MEGEETEKIWTRFYNTDLLNYFKTIIPKCSGRLMVMAEFQVEKSEGKGTSCNTHCLGVF